MVNYVNSHFKVLFFLLLLLSFISFNSNASAATFSTVPVNSGCSYPCDGYYTSHFDAKIEATSYNSAYYQSSVFRGTMTHANENGDQWGIMTLNVYSGGSQIHQSIPGKLYTAANSSYWQRISTSQLIEKGNNRIDFNFAYVLKTKSGTIAERWYPVLRASNIN